MGPALGVIELSSMVRGPVVVDAMVKRAGVRIFHNRPLSTGKLLIMAEGGVAEMEESMLAGQDAASGRLLDHVLLPQAHEQLWDFLSAPASKALARREHEESVGLIEVASLATTIALADIARKAAEVCLVDMQLGTGIGGRGFFSLTGSLEDVQAALEDAERAAPDGTVLGTEVIARPHEDLATSLFW